MLKRFLRRAGALPIAEAAGEAFKRGDTVFIRKFHPSPTKGDQDLAQAIQDVTAIGWTLTSTQFEGAGLSRHANLVFSRS
ncbi:hypothetical protein OTB20_08295 [Streptomyces sp. H27-H1]|uniref:hypothetical protein n=1 Tax=Streptomyces sp. H27-H1 TaxID=2996461 RepID=UPI00226E2C2D|nr:hypothetical protein [Streptomyces sp. H27-H1]MCY0926204.1 hypothetical protein [Streptomyces sp. H27-H1]